MKRVLRQFLVKFYIRIVNLCIREVKVQFDRVVILAPHPDDEIIGMGGFIIQMLQQNKKVHIVFLTDGEESNSFPDKNRIKEERINLSREVLEKLNLPEEYVHRLHLPDSDVPRKGAKGFEDAVKKILKIVDDIEPNAIFSTHYLEYWPIDHIACFELAQEVVLRSKTKVESWLYWVWTWHNLRPWQLLKIIHVNKYNIEKNLSEKERLIDLYISKKSPQGIPWSGNLPPMMLFPFSKPIEIFEKYNPK